MLLGSKLGAIDLSVLATQSEIELYVDNIRGSDGNSGSASSPLKTLIEAESRLPFFINHRVVIHVLPYDTSVPNVGRYTWPTFRARILSEKIIIVGDSYQTVSTGTAQAGTDQLHVVSTGGLTPDEYVNAFRFIKITTGAAAGDIRIISENDATDIEPSYPFTGVVNPGDTYEIVQPLIRFDVPAIEDRCVLAEGTQLGRGGEWEGVPESGIYLVNAKLEFAGEFVSIDEVPFAFFMVQVISPEPTYFRSMSGILAGVEELRSYFPSVRCSTLLESIPILCPTASALAGCGLAVSGSLYLHTFFVGFDGFVVSTGNIGTSVPFFDQTARFYPNAALRGGRCNQILCGNSSAHNGGYLKVDTARIPSHPHINFKVRANSSLPGVRARYCKIVLKDADVQNAGSGPAVSAVGLAALIAIYYSDGVSSGGIGLMAEEGGEVRCDGNSTFSGSTGDFSEDGGVTLRAWSTLLADTWFRDAVRGSLICRP